MPELSVIIPTYNAQELTIRALESVLAQNVSCDIIIVDDASDQPFRLPDNLQVLKNVQLLRRGQNGGAGAARNSGIEVAATEWISFLDCDDVMVPDSLAGRIEFALSHDAGLGEDDLTAYVCGWRDTRSARQNNPVRIPNPASQLEEFCSGCWYSPGSTLIARKSLFQNSIGKFFEPLRRLEDLDWFIRFGQAGGSLVVQPVVGLEIEPGNNPELDKIRKAGKILADQHAMIKRQNPAAYRRLLAYLDLEYATYAARRKSYIRAIYWTMRSFFRVPRTRLHLSPGWQDNSIVTNTGRRD